MIIARSSSTPSLSWGLFGSRFSPSWYAFIASSNFPKKASALPFREYLHIKITSYQVTKLKLGDDSLPHTWISNQQLQIGESWFIFYWQQVRALAKERCTSFFSSCRYPVGFRTFSAATQKNLLIEVWFLCRTHVRRRVYRLKSSFQVIDRLYK